MGYFGEPPFDSGYFASLSESDYFDCDYFDPTYFETPDCGGGEVTTGHPARRIRRIQPTVLLLDEADEFLAVI